MEHAQEVEIVTVDFPRIGQRGLHRAAAFLIGGTTASGALVRRALRPSGLRLGSAGSVESGLRRLSNLEVSLVLINVNSAAVDGVRIAELTRSVIGAETPIIFLLSGEPAKSTLDRLSEVPSSDILYWPNDPATLRAKASVLLRLRGESAAIRQVLVQAEVERQSRDDAIAIAAHELRDPVGVIAGYVDMLREGNIGVDSSAWPTVLDAITEKTAELQQLIDSLLLSSRADAGRLDSWIEPVSLASLVRAACDRAAPRALLLGGEVNCKVPSSDVKALGDQRHIGTILDNLINNALSHSGANPMVEVRLHPTGDPTIDVSDNGHGIAPEMRERIFDRFIRAGAPDVRKSGGTGLGLYICRQLADSQGGSISVTSSSSDLGSVFRLILRPVIQ